MIYYIANNCRRFCISITCKQKVFRITHNENQHVDRYCCYQRIIDILYISHLSKKLQLYLKYCFNCQLNQTKRYKLYKKLIFVISSSKLFYILIINFVVALPKIFDILLTITNKFFKYIALIYNKTIYNVKK